MTQTVAVSMNATGRARAELSLGAAARLFLRFPDAAGNIAIVLLLAAFRALAGPLTAMDFVTALAAFIGWPLIEWFLHRYLMHMRPVRLWGRTIEPRFARNHREHHRRPLDVVEVFWSWQAAVGEAAISFAVLRLITRASGPALTGACGLLAMTLSYNWIHFLTHTQYRPRSEFCVRRFRIHRLHHFKNEGYWFAFTWPIVDRMLRTGPDHRDIPYSANCRDLRIDGRPWDVRAQVRGLAQRWKAVRAGDGPPPSPS
jgi:fatty acid hydroxylase family protein